MDASNVDIEGKPTEEMIQLINNNQRDIFAEMNKYNESQIHNLIDENEQILGCILNLNQSFGVVGHFGTLTSFKWCMPSNCLDIRSILCVDKRNWRLYAYKLLNEDC